MLPVKPIKAKLKIAYIFVMTQLSRDNLIPLIWIDAENRAAASIPTISGNVNLETSYKVY